jgi:hypothetical protein
LFSQSWGKARQLWPKQMIYTHKWLDIKNNVWHSTQTSKNNTYTLSNLFWLNHLYFNQDNPSIKISRESLAPEMLLCFLLLLSTPTYLISAYNWDLTAKDYKANDMANHNKQKKSMCWWIKEHGDIHSNDDVKKNVGGKQDLDQDCSMDIYPVTENWIYNRMWQTGNSEGLIVSFGCHYDCAFVIWHYLLVRCYIGHCILCPFQAYSVPTELKIMVVRLFWLVLASYLSTKWRC